MRPVLVQSNLPVIVLLLRCCSSAFNRACRSRRPRCLPRTCSLVPVKTYLSGSWALAAEPLL